MAEIKNVKLKIQKFGVHIKVRDFERSFRFYSAFGLSPVFAYGDKRFLETLPEDLPKANEKYRGIIFDIGGSLLEIADGHVAVKREVFLEEIKNSKISFMVHVDSVSKILDVCRNNNFKILIPPKKYPWRTTEVVIKDPDGVVVVFIEKQ